MQKIMGHSDIGMTMKYAHNHFQSIMYAFSKLGYEVGWRVLNAKDYGVPQATPLQDVLVAIALSFLSMALKKYLKI